MNRLFLRALLSAFILISLSSFAMAQDQQAASDAHAASPAVSLPVETTTTSDPSVLDEAGTGENEITVIKDKFAVSDYNTPNMENLSKLYWRLNVFKLSDNLAIDNYLIINECDVYRNFFKDDFEWAGVRKATRDMLNQQAATFSNQFKILVPIDLGRYDANRGGFAVSPTTAFVNSRRIQVTGSSQYYTGCDQKRDLKGYPSRVVLILNKPFTFNFVKVDEHVAQAFLLRKKYNSVPLPKELRNKGFQRPAFARMRVTFVRYQGVMKDQGNRDMAILYGTLDGIDVFEDLKEEMLLSSINYQ